MLYRYVVINLVTLILLIALPGTVRTASLAVFNGADVTQGEYPWMVGVAQATVTDGYTAQFCGGTLIDSEWVLTAAHCTYDFEEQPFAPAAVDVIIGRNRLSSQQGERIRVDQIIRHPAFEPTTLRSDIALLHLAQSTAVTPLVLGQIDLQATSATIVGWGVTQDGTAADNLQEAQVPLVPLDVCRLFYSSYGVSILSSMRCAGDATGHVDACVGDSGGPLVIWQAERQSWAQIGIISWGAACGTTGAYGVYTNIGSFIDWIQLHTTA